MAVNRRRPASGKEVAAAAAMEVVVAGGGRGGVVALAGRPAGLTGYTMAVAAFYSPSMELERRKIFSAMGLESGVSRTTGRRIGITRIKLF